MQKSSNKTRVIFLGTADFAVPVLKALHEAGHEIVAVITQSDKPTGRKQILTPPPIKITAKELGLNVLQPEKIRDNNELAEEIKKLNADVGIVSAYGKFIPPEIFNLPKHGILVVHPSLLPRYRGPSPVQAAIMNGDTETGVTIIKMDEEMDHGDIIASASYQIPKNGLFNQINKEIWHLGTKLLIQALPDYLTGKIQPTPQDHKQTTTCKIIKKEDGKINWNKDAMDIYNQFRAFHEWPGTWTIWNNKILKITECKITDNQPYHDHEETYIGKVYQEGEQIYIPCHKGHIEINRLQLEGSIEMGIREFISGHPNFVGSLL